MQRDFRGIAGHPNRLVYILADKVIAEQPFPCALAHGGDFSLITTWPNLGFVGDLASCSAAKISGDCRH
jgi:FPC/CPF motif-containing protein YcgG